FERSSLLRFVRHGREEAITECGVLLPPCLQMSPRLSRYRVCALNRLPNQGNNSAATVVSVHKTRGRSVPSPGGPPRRTSSTMLLDEEGSYFGARLISGDINCLRSVLLKRSIPPKPRRPPTAYNHNF